MPKLFYIRVEKKKGVRMTGHPCHINYGIFRANVRNAAGEEVPTMRLQLKFIDEDGKTRNFTTGRTYHSEAQRKRAMTELRKIRAKKYKDSRFIKHLERSYANPYLPGCRSRTQYGKQEKYTVPGLIGIAIIAFPLERSGAYISVRSVVRDQNGKQCAQEWNVDDYGLQSCLRKATTFRCNINGARKPSLRKIKKAAADAGDYLRRCDFTFRG